MSRLTCIRAWCFWTIPAISLLGVGCDYSSPEDDEMATGAPSSRDLPSAPAVPGTSASASAAAAPVLPPSLQEPDEDSAEKTAILDNVIQLIQTAAIKPGGQNFGNATKNLNQYFSGVKPADYKLDPKAREFLSGLALEALPQERIGELESPNWTMPDARHMEDCMLYNGIATRVAGVGDDLTRVRRVFEWTVQQIQLVPAGSLGSPGLGQAFARPFDVLLRGMATESEGFWSERGWLFLSLCRQLGLDGGLVAYTPAGAKTPVIWCSAILIGQKPYLFDARVGLPIPDAKGDGVATLEEAMTNPIILGRMDIPRESPYGTTREALLGSTSKIDILLDSSLRYFSPKMRLLQQSLAGKNLTILFRDPAEQRDRWLEALGPRAGKVGLWELPMMVETLLFTNPQFVEATQNALFLFRPEFPLLYARMKQLRGETAEAMQDYVAFRFAENGTLMDKKTPTPPEIQGALDVYATYFLAMCHLERDDPAKASLFFEKTLQVLPEYGPGLPYFTMFRWGAQSNLGRILEAKGDTLKATAYYGAKMPTYQRHGNLLRARELVWRDPMGPLPPPLPPAPKAKLAATPAPAASAAAPKPGNVN